jgi:hypothetical protein
MHLGVVLSYATYYYQISFSFRRALLAVRGVKLRCREKICRHRQQLGYGSYVAYITLPCISCSVISCRFNGMKVFVVDPCISGVAAGISAGYMKHSGIYNPHPTSHTYTHTQTYKQTNRPCPLADNRQLILYTNCENGPVFTHFNSTQGRAVSYICGVKCVRISCGIKQLSYFPRPD